MKSWEFASHYHEETKHHFHRYARSLGDLDWDNQPDPFRRFDTAPLIPLLLTDDASSPSYDDLFRPGRVTAQPVCFESISAFFELSLAISAWKEFRGSRWALRINPSSGNLHPTEGYLVIGPVESFSRAPGVYHYAAKEHALERRTEFTLNAWQQLGEGFPAPGAPGFFAGLSSIHWREGWKYGERAYRYCQHDAGHALTALAVSAAVQGWWVRLLDGLSDAEIASLLGLNRKQDFSGAEQEHPDLLVAVIASSKEPRSLPPCLAAEAIARVAGGVWTGSANRLSGDHRDWEIIDAVADACSKSATEPTVLTDEGHSFGAPLEANRPAVPASKIIRQRRSAVALDGKTGLTAGQFYLILDRVLPRMDRIPFNALGLPVCVHLGLFVHLVEGVPPGLYCLVRSPEQLPKLREAMRSSFTWEKPQGCPDSLPLYLLTTGDCRAVAWKVSCDQQIAGAGAFSLGMIAEFEPRLREFGAWFYRRLFWETGVIGQILYLEAEAAGIRSTGIGCFFDDPVHDVFGLTGTTYQSLYHFTMGGPVEDTRLTTLPAYPVE